MAAADSELAAAPEPVGADAWRPTRTGREVVFGALAAASQPTEALTVSEWADRYRIVSPESGSPWPGPWRTARIPYLREPQDCLHPDHPARRVTLRWAAQLGKSSAIENWFCFVVDQSPGSMMIVLPTLEEATKFNRIKLQPTIDATKRIAHKVAPTNSRDEGASTTAFKRFAGGFCQIVNAGSSKGLQMVTIKYLAMDEIAGYPRDVDGRGSPRDQARARQKMLGDLAKELQGSTTGIAGECPITEDFEAGDQRLYYVPCPHCDRRQPLEFGQMRGPDQEAGIDAHFRCLSCDGAILDGHKPDLLAAGVWIATRPDASGDRPPKVMTSAELAAWRCEPLEGRCRDRQPSYHLWAAYAPKERFRDLWARWERAQGDTTKLRVFYQQDLAEPYDPAGAALEHETILAAVVARPIRVVPAEAAVLVSAADVQSYGIKWAVYAIGPGSRRWLIDRRVFEGAPDQSDEPWIALADALQTVYPTAGGGTKAIDLSGVDAGFATWRVYRFCAARPRCYALDGQAEPGRPWLGTPSRRTVKDASGRIVAAALLYPVGLYDVKTEVVASLANLVQGPASDGRWPRNVLHLPADLADEAFVKELTAETLVDADEGAAGTAGRRKAHVRPDARRVWRKRVGRANDWFDVTVYAYALAWHLGCDRVSAERWAELIADVHARPPEPTLFALAEDPFRSKPAEVAAGAEPKPADRAERPTRGGIGAPRGFLKGR